MRERVVIALKGACMGFADAIPGVSGGTMALILGIYSRFVAAISSLGPSTLPLLLKSGFYKAVLVELVPGEQEPEAGPFKDAARHIAFLMNVVVGILTGVLVGVLVLPILMERYPEIMRAFFLGLVFASIVVPWGMIRTKSMVSVCALLVIAVATAALMGLGSVASGFARTSVVVTTPGEVPLTEDMRIPAIELKFATNTGQKKLKREMSFQPEADIHFKAGEAKWEFPVLANQSGVKSNLPAGSLVLVVDAVSHTRRSDLEVSQPKAAAGGQNPALWYVFVCGSIAISAMLLPGISGSFLLLMLGLYGYILHSVRGLITLQDTSGAEAVVIFILGLVIGILAFSRFLTWLLSTYHDLTMACLAGLMLGSLRALWPFRVGAGHLAQNVIPPHIDGTVWGAMAAAVFGLLLVTVLNKVGRKTPT